jgi:hypothetical protein
MRKITNDGLLLCKIQAETFEKSIDKMNTSSEIFVRRFMRSSIVKQLDNEAILATNLQANDILDFINEEYGVSNYGSVKYSKDEMYWIGYIYRYFAYTYEWTSSRIYKNIKPKELRAVYLPYQTLDPSQAIERILEAKGLPTNEEEELQRQYAIFRRIRNETKYKNRNNQ